MVRPHEQQSAVAVGRRRPRVPVVCRLHYHDIPVAARNTERIERIVQEKEIGPEEPVDDCRTGPGRTAVGRTEDIGSTPARSQGCILAEEVVRGHIVPVGSHGYGRRADITASGLGQMAYHHPRHLRSFASGTCGISGIVQGQGITCRQSRHTCRHDDMSERTQFHRAESLYCRKFSILWKVK